MAVNSVNLGVKKVTDFVVVPLKSSERTSKCWEYFGKLVLCEEGKRCHVDTDKVYCKLCVDSAQGKVQAADDGDDEAEPGDPSLFGHFDIKAFSAKISTGNLTRHLSDSHNLTETKKVSSNANIRNFFEVVSRQDQSRTSSSSRRDDTWLLARDIAIWFCRDLMPFNAVSDGGLEDFMKKRGVVSMEGKLPDRTTISRAALDDIYEVALKAIKELLGRSGRHGAITFDLWTDRYKRLGYITFTYHFISEDIELHHLTLRTWMMALRKTGENIRDEINAVQLKFGLQDQDICFVTDSGANVKKACRLTKMEHHSCLGHGLHNLVTTDGIRATPTAEKIETKIRKILKIVRYRAPELEEEFEKDQRKILTDIPIAAAAVDADNMDPVQTSDEVILDDEEIEEEELPEVGSSQGDSIGSSSEAASATARKKAPTVKGWIATRWHILLTVLESMGPNRNGINVILMRLEKAELMLSVGEWEFLEKLRKFLLTFRNATETLSGEKFTTINVALLMRSELEDCLQIDEEEDFLAIVQMKRSMQANLDKRFPITDLTAVAALIDPRFQNLNNLKSYIEETLISTKEDFLVEQVRKRVKSSDLWGFEKNNDAATSATSLQSTQDRLISRAQKHSQQDNAHDTIKRECTAFLNTCHAAQVVNGDILKFWKERRAHFPWLAALARAVLCVPATSTPSERVFSVAGLTLNAKRSDLHPARVDKIIFIHNNYDLLKKCL